jgi:hypothetical protein
VSVGAPAFCTDFGPALGFAMKAQICSAPPGIMAGMDSGVGELHLAVCRRFGDAVRSADGNGIVCCWHSALSKQSE